MRKGLCAAALAVLLSLPCAASAQEETDIGIYVAGGAMAQETAQQLVALVDRALPGAQVHAVYGAQTGQTLRELVLMDDAPQIALCAPEEAAIWAAEGLLLPMDGRISGSKRMAQQVLLACAQEGETFMAPLLARHRSMAVNRRMLEAEGLGGLLDSREYPVWFPMQMQQVLDEMAADGKPALELWPAEQGGSAAVEALVQAIYGGALLSEDGELCQAGSGAALAGVTWLQDMALGGLIGMAESREAALTRFLSGETALFIDWTDEEARRLHAAGEDAPEIVTVAYPSSSGLPVRSFEVTGAVVFSSGDEATDALCLQAVEFFLEDAQVQLILGDRAIWEDGAVWLPGLGDSAQGRRMRSALALALPGLLAGEMTPAAALGAVAAAAGAAQP